MVSAEANPNDRYGRPVGGRVGAPTTVVGRSPGSSGLLRFAPTTALEYWDQLSVAVGRELTARREMRAWASDLSDSPMLRKPKDVLRDITSGVQVREEALRISRRQSWSLQAIDFDKSVKNAAEAIRRSNLSLADKLEGEINTSLSAKLDRLRGNTP